MFLREIFKEHYDITDSVAKNILSILQPTLEKEIGIEFAGSHLHGRSRIVPYMKKRHPQSIMEKPNPFISIGFTTDVDDQDGVYSSSTFRTDVASYIDPKEFTDVLLQNADRRDLDKNIEVRLAFDNVNMNCDIALLFDTPARQLQCKRIWEVLYETGREYEVNMMLKAPIATNVIKEWCNLFNLDINDLDSVLIHMQERSEFMLTREIRTLTGGETIYFHYQCRARLKYERVESNSTDEHGNTAMVRLVARLLNIRFNAPSIYYIVDKDDIRTIGMGSQGIIESVDKVHLDGVSDTMNGMNSIYHESFIFDTPIKNIYNLISDYSNFMDWVLNKYGTYENSLKILIRDTSKTANKDSITSEDYIDIGYNSLTLRLKNTNMLNKPFDLRIYINGVVHGRYMADRAKTETVNNTIDIIDIAHRESDDIISDELKAIIGI